MNSNLINSEPNDKSIQSRPSSEALQGHPVGVSDGKPGENSALTEVSKGSQCSSSVSVVNLFGEQIVSMDIDGTKRLCLAQISHTLLKDFSYNEIHNRRVALGITCIQCTPVQLEVLRRSGAMPISSRRCGMITFREAERLCKSFLCESYPPPIPENFQFRVYHTCSWGCSGTFHPNRYNSSRAKCIRCEHCNVFFSPNKFIFHSHREISTKYSPPDAANFNSWRRHIYLSAEHSSDEQINHAWEDVKAMFNGGTRKRSSLGIHSESSPISKAKTNHSKLAKTTFNKVESSNSFTAITSSVGKLKSASSSHHELVRNNNNLSSKVSSFGGGFENMLKTSGFGSMGVPSMGEFLVNPAATMYNPMATAAALLGPAAIMMPWFSPQSIGSLPSLHSPMTSLSEGLKIPMSTSMSFAPSMSSALTEYSTAIAQTLVNPLSQRFIPNGQSTINPTANLFQSKITPMAETGQNETKIAIDSPKEKPFNDQRNWSTSRFLGQSSPTTGMLAEFLNSRQVLPQEGLKNSPDSTTAEYSENEAST